MAPHLQDLPDELLVEVLGYLPKSDLKSARLACTRYGRIGAQWLFQRVYFAPRKSVIETFLNISANPTFARTVTELVYDGRLFLPELVAYKPYKKAFDAYIPVPDNNILVGDTHGVGEGDLADGDEVGNGTGPTNNVGGDSTPMSRSATLRSIGGEGYHETLANNLVCYTRLFEQQQNILEDHKDYEALLTGLTNLPHIITITVTGTYFQHSDLFQDLRLWNEAGVVQPAQWSRDMHPGGVVGDKWDVRGVQNLIRAVSVHCQKVSRLNLARTSSAPMTFFEMDQDVYEAACKMAKRLTSLELSLYVSMSDSGDDVQFQYEGLEGFLLDAKELRCLTIRGRIEFGCINHIVWPHLETLNLESFGFDAASLKVMMQAHQGTLRDLEFCNVYLYGDEGWAHTAKELGKYLRLRRICILGVCDDVTREALGGQPYLDDEANRAVARNFMQSIPRTEADWDEYTITACPDDDSLPVEAGNPHNSSTTDDEEEDGEGEDEYEEDEDHQEQSTL